MKSAAIILCAGKGTRMNDDSKNKVCFDCAGVPTIKRIITDMKKAGVNKFVVVIGHQAYSVMDTLDGEDGVIYVYQKEQKGTGHAAMCGLKALKSLDYDGPVIISMGDKIINSDVIQNLLQRAKSSKVVWAVQPLSANFNGGRVVSEGDKPYGIVEFADAALMKLGQCDKKDYEKTLKEIKLSDKKAKKVLKIASQNKPKSAISLCGKTFTADEVLNTKYANAGLYCMDLNESIKVLSNLGSNNAQGEIYITDALEIFSKNNDALLYEIKNPDDMLTYSTRSELREISKHFMRRASDFISDIKSGDFDNYLIKLYGVDIDKQKQRYIDLLNLFISKYGDKKVVISRSPARVNLMGRHIDHRGGSINVMATDKDTVFVSGMREDDNVLITNVNTEFPDREFSISKCLGDKKYEKWLDYLNDQNVVRALNESNGCWSNYVKSAILRLQFEYSTPFCGMEMAASGTIPVAAGLSSSSSIVVSVMEAIVSLNSLNISNNRFIELCGEGEWFVGSRGGAGDHAAMKCANSGSIVNLSFKPFKMCESAPFSDKYCVIVANSMIKAKKSEGSKDKFNAQVASYEFAFMLIKRYFPEFELEEFRDIANIRPYSKIYEILKTIPETVTRGAIKALLPEYKERINQIFSTHKDPGVYDLRGVSLYGISECERAKKYIELLADGKYDEIGKMMKISHDGDRTNMPYITDEVLDKLILENTDISLECGRYDCSTSQIDYLCDCLNQTDGVLGSQIAGAGLGGCVIALVESKEADKIISVINEKYYDKYNYEHSAYVYSASHGSCVVY